MLFFEEYARFGLLLHAVLATALVASSTHLVLWMRRYPSGRYTRVLAARRFAVITCVLYGATFFLGNLLYPTYKVRVRAAYLDDGSAVVRGVAAQIQNAESTRRRYLAGRAASQGIDGQVAETPVPNDPAAAARGAKKLARWFDVKEHWVALGLMMSALCAVLLFSWRPSEHPRYVPMLAFVLAILVALTTWSGAIIGVLLASVRSVGGL